MRLPLLLEASSRLIDKDEGAGVKQEDRHGLVHSR